MKKKLLVTAVALGFGANGASAGLNMLGSDTLRALTQDIIADCGIPASSLTYGGTGSSNGGLAMVNGTQQVAPMSRFLTSTECKLASAPVGTVTGQGYKAGLDGIAVFHDTTQSSACGTLRYAGKMPILDLNNGAVGFLGYGLGVAGLDDGSGTATAPLVDNAATPNCNEAVEYCFTHWADVLRIIYTGQHSHLNDSSNAAACTNAVPTSSTGASALATKRCNSDVRRTLVETWSNMFDQPNNDGVGGCTDTHCTRLKHAFRRDDRSGTTDAFLQIIGAPSLGSSFTARSFCNGIENEDSDVIRRDCSATTATASDTDSVCNSIKFVHRKAPFGADGSPSGVAGSTAPTVVTDATAVGDLGLVLAISLPLDTTIQYDTTVCAASGGQFKSAPMDAATLPNAQTCPDGTGRAGGFCRWPVYSSGPNAGRFNCRAKRNTRPGNIIWQGMDGRQYNRVPRNPADGVILQPNNSIADPRWTGGGDYRIHMAFAPASQTATAYTLPQPTCTQSDATRQIGCLVQADPCSIGFAGLEASDTNANAAEIAIAGTNAPWRLRSPLDTDTAETLLATDATSPDTEILPDRLNPTSIQDLVLPAPAVCNRYGLARILWFNSTPGFATVVNSPGGNLTQEADTLDLLQNRAAVETRLDQHGFIRLPANYPAAFPVESDPELPVRHKVECASARA